MTHDKRPANHAPLSHLFIKAPIHLLVHISLRRGRFGERQCLIWNSVRRFFARPCGLSLPSGFSFGAIGRLLPRPTASSLVAAIPLAAKYFTTASDRCWESL